MEHISHSSGITTDGVEGEIGAHTTGNFAEPGDKFRTPEHVFATQHPSKRGGGCVMEVRGR